MLRGLLKGLDGWAAPSQHPYLFRTWDQPPLVYPYTSNGVLQWAGLNFFVRPAPTDPTHWMRTRVKPDVQGRAIVLLGEFRPHGFFTAWMSFEQLREALMRGDGEITFMVPSLIWLGANTPERGHQAVIHLREDLRGPLSIWLDSIEESDIVQPL